MSQPVGDKPSLTNFKDLHALNYIWNDWS